VTACGSCKNRRFGLKDFLYRQGEKIGELGTTLAVTNNKQFLVTAYIPSSLIAFAMMMEAIRSFETYVLTRATQRHIPEDDILHIHRLENLTSYIPLTDWAL
jgi:hypothetical protein